MTTRSFPQLRRFDHDAAALLYVQGMSTPKIAKQCGVSSHSIYVALKKMGIQMRSISDSVSAAKRGNRRIDSGYITVCVDKNVRRKEHVLIAELTLGRPLEKNEVVHHINELKTDNRRNNLLICTRAYHTALHNRMRKQALLEEKN